MRLTKREKAFSTKTLVAALCILALLRTRPIHFTLIHICSQKQKGKKEFSLFLSCELNLE